MDHLIRRIRERKIVQWTVVYLAGAWVFLEALGFVADTFSWPARGDAPPLKTARKD